MCVFCRLVRLAEGGFSGSRSAITGLASGGGAFRFRVEVGGRADEAAGTAEPCGDGSEATACLAEARVILEDMSMLLDCDAVSLILPTPHDWDEDVDKFKDVERRGFDGKSKKVD